MTAGPAFGKRSAFSTGGFHEMVARRYDAARSGGSIGLLLAGHGTRDEQGRAEFLRLCRQIARRLPQTAVERCCLEMAEPSIGEAVERLADRGVRRAAAIPLLLLAAGHAKRDIPRAVLSAARRRGLDVCFVGRLGCCDAALELSARRFGQALGKPDGLTWRDTALAMAGRGARDPAALAEIHRFLELRRRRTPVGCAEVGFLAMAPPRLPAVLSRVARKEFRRIVVQPHLLFHGCLLLRLHEAVAAAAAEFPDRQWLVADHLGPSERLAREVAQRYRAACRLWRPEAGLPSEMCLG